MMRFLLMQIEGMMASWGVPSQSSHRPTLDHPTKSAVMGLVGASLGIQRGDYEATQNLDQNLSLAIYVHRYGKEDTDFQTAAAPNLAAARRARVRTRAQELALPNLNTQMIYKAYRYDVSYLVGLCPTEDLRWTLEELQEALLSPHWTPFLGRKTCVPSAPFHPQILEAENFLAACRESHFGIEVQPGNSIYWGGDIPSGVSVCKTYTRNDSVLEFNQRYDTRNENHGFVEATSCPS